MTPYGVTLGSKKVKICEKDDVKYSTKLLLGYSTKVPCGESRDIIKFYREEELYA